MGKYVRECKAECELAVMEVGPLTRARKMALLAAEAAESGGAKRRKVNAAQFKRLVPERELVCRNPGSAARVASLEECRKLDRNPGAASRCSSNGSCEEEALGRLRSAADLEAREDSEAGQDFDSRPRRSEATPTSNKSEELDSATTTTPSEAEANSRRKPPPVSPAVTAPEMPPAAELDAFFTAAEKLEQRRFADKYNYDVEKDAPSDGRYEWVRLK